MSDRKRVLIVGGVAGGASCATRLRRLSEETEIVMFERGPYVSFANCGLPYFVGDIVPENKLQVASAELFTTRFNIEVRTENEVLAIDRARREIEVLRLHTGEKYRESYDALVLAPGAAPVRPAVPGVDLPGIFVLRTIPDSRAIKAWIESRSVKRAVIVGGGLIGLEMAENLVARGISVTVVEMLDQVLPPLDPEMAAPVQQHLVANGVDLRLGDGLAGFESLPNGAVGVKTQSGQSLPADMVILSIGVKPDTKLARDAGLEVGQRGGIRVDASMRTSDPNIWAVGDAVETMDVVTGQPVVVPLAGPANRQGRVAADSICGRDAQFRGMQASAVCGVFGLTVAMTGANEKNLKRAGWKSYKSVYLHPGHHAGFYPGAKPIHMKLLFAPDDGRVLGAQAVGEQGVEKRIDVVAMAIQKGATVFDLEEAELCYAPQFGSAKDPVNMAGMIAANIVRGDASVASWDELYREDSMVIDVRDPEEFVGGHIDGAINIPLRELRKRISELPRDREILVYCGVGQRAYNAVRILRQHEFEAHNLSGGFTTFQHLRRASDKKSSAVASS